MDELEQALGHVMGRLAHDVKNPLAVVLSNLSFLLGEIRDPDQLEALRESLYSAERSIHLIEDAVDLLRLSSGQLPLAPAVVPLPPLEAPLRGAVEPLAGRRSLSIELPPVSLRVDGGLLSRALVNLLLHGLRHTPSGETVRLHGALEEGLILRLVDGGAPFTPEVVPSFLARRIEQREATKPPWRSDQGLSLLFAGFALRALGAAVDLAERPDGARGVVFQLHFPPGALG